MFRNYTRELKELNQLDLDSIKGKRMYYNKTRNSISLIFGLTFQLSYIILCISQSGPDSSMWVVVAFVFGLIMIYFTRRMASILLLKNPVFILQGEQIYYIKTNTWYPIMEYDFRDEIIGRHNFYETFCMYDKKGNLIIAEKNWNLKDEEVFKSQIKYNKLILSRNN